MSIFTKATVGTVAVLCGLAISPAFAANAYVTQTSDVYKNPSSNSMVITTLAKNKTVTVIDCQGNYCLLSLPGPDGWIKQSRLGGLQSGNPSKVPFSFGFSVGGDGKPSISIGIGNGNGPVIEPEEDDEVCFYKGANFTGSKLCVEPGDSDDSLSSSWDDSISSIKVYGEAEVTVCRDEDLEGICANISSSKSTLPNALNNKISSYEVN